MDNLLTTENLSVDFETDQGIVHAVRNVSFHLNKGEILGIVGESGSGKSVTMYSIMGLLGDTAHIQCGKMLFDGTDINPCSYQSKKAYSAVMRDLCGSRMAMIFQDPMTFLNPTMKIGKQLCEPILNHTSMTKQQARQRALELMSLVGIPSPETRIDQYPFEFSGGMRQRIIIAIALASNARIMICDEPTTALDVTIQAKILDEIKEIKRKQKLSVILITHDLGVVANMADRICVMYAGKIVEVGTAREIFYSPAHPYTWALLSSMPDLETKERLFSIPGTPPNMIFPPKGDAFAERNQYAMQVDFEEEPPFFKLSDTHYAATWLLHPNAPKVEMPEALQHRIARMNRKEGV